MPTVGKTPGSGILSTGREPHAIHGVTLPFAVILTAHRLQSPRRPARQTAQDLVIRNQKIQSVQSNCDSGHVNLFLIEEKLR